MVVRLLQGKKKPPEKCFYLDFDINRLYFAISARGWPSFSFQALETFKYPEIDGELQKSLQNGFFPGLVSGQIPTYLSHRRRPL
jgi:hypothetical protein